MISPNLYTLPPEKAGVFALHKFKDGEVALCQQHKCGDWLALRKPTAAELRHFEKYGKKV